MLHCKSEIINDLLNISQKMTFFLFADDTNIYYESHDLNEFEKTVNCELKKTKSMA